VPTCELVSKGYAEDEGKGSVLRDDRIGAEANISIVEAAIVLLDGDDFERRSFGRRRSGLGWSRQRKRQ